MSSSSLKFALPMGNLDVPHLCSWARAMAPHVISQFKLTVVVLDAKSKVNNRAKCLTISQVIRAKLYSKLSHTCL